jgi:hypothetical protein
MTMLMPRGKERSENELFATLLTSLNTSLMEISRKDWRGLQEKTFPCHETDENFYDLFVFLASLVLFASLQFCLLFPVAQAEVVHLLFLELATRQSWTVSGQNILEKHPNKTGNAWHFAHERETARASIEKTFNCGWHFDPLFLDLRRAAAGKSLKIVVVWPEKLS